MQAKTLAIVLVALLAGASAPAQQVREERTVVVDSVRETWRLVWTGKPRNACNVEERDLALTCPCAGWAYGEAGGLALVRLRSGHEIDRLQLAPLFAGEFPVEPGEAILQLRPDKPDDMKRFIGDDPMLVAEIARRTPTQAMQLADYDRDGAATEFLLQVQTLACGKRQLVAVGVSKADPRLHALTSTGHPERPLVMPRQAWDALLKAPGPTTVVWWPCDDHGSEVESRLTVEARDGRIRVVHRDLGCESAGTLGQVLKTAEW